MKKLIIAGGTGFLGQVLIQYFQKKYDKIVVLSRQKRTDQLNVCFEIWDGKSKAAWVNQLEGAETLINLSGKSVDCRYNDKNKTEILHSRIDSTRVLNEAILSCSNPPKHFINSSTATIYQHSLNEPNTESDGIIGDDFSMHVAKSWEKAFFEVSQPNLIKTALRASIVLGLKGGAFPKLKQITALGLGGKQGKGNQMISWIHANDYAKAIDFVISKKIDGILNITSPHPVTNVEFMSTLRRKMGVKFGVNSPKFLLEIASFLLKTETELLLKSRFVLPQTLINLGFTYDFGTLDDCLENLCNSYKEKNKLVT
jgi:uncharacterized protein (TIGR01777 family)